MGKHLKEKEKARRKLRKKKKLKKRSILNRGRQFCNIDPCVSTSTTSQHEYVSNPGGSPAVNPSVKEATDKRQISQSANKSFSSQAEPRKKVNFANDPLITRYREYLVLERRLGHIKEATEGFSGSH